MTKKAAFGMTTTAITNDASFGTKGDNLMIKRRRYMPWDYLTLRERDEAINILNGSEKRHPNVAWFAERMFMTQPTGRHPHILLSVGAVILLGLCLVANGANAFWTAWMIFLVTFLLGRINVRYGDPA